MHLQHGTPMEPAAFSALKDDSLVPQPPYYEFCLILLPLRVISWLTKNLT